MNQPSLFEGSVRASDPSTSHDAAASMDETALSRQRGEVLGFVRWRSELGTTAYEVSLAYPIQQNVAARRLRDLCELGFVKDSGRTRPGSSGRHGIVWVTA